MKKRKHTKNVISLYVEKPGRGMWLTTLVKRIPYEKKSGYAGYKSRDALKKFLAFSIFGKKQVQWQQPDMKKIKKTIAAALKKCKPLLHYSVHIIIFSTVNKFIVEKMKGIAGYTPWKNTIIINIYPSKKWDQALKETIGHEITHAYTLNIRKPKSVLDNLIFEGIAEHVREQTIGGGKAVWTRSLSKQQAKDILNNIRSQLTQHNQKLSKDLFFGTGEYPLWAGYALGYYLIEDYLNKRKKKEWKSLIKTPPRTILRESGW